MNSDLKILINTSDQLKIYSPITFGVFTLIVMLITSGPLAVLYIRHADRINTVRKSLGIALVCLGILGPLLTSIWSHTVTLNRSTNDVTIVDQFAGVIYETRHYPLSDVREAIAQYARPGGRIALIMRSGLDVQPLGKAYNSNSMQYKAINLINAFIQEAGQVDGQSGHGSPASTPHFQELERRMEETERKNAETQKPAEKNQ